MPATTNRNRVEFTDQLGRKLAVPFPPKKIVSIVPSQTELLADLGLMEEVIGITKFCIHPEHWFRTKTRVGGTKNLNIEKIRSLGPDLIIANKEENSEKQIYELIADFPVWISDIKTLSDAFAMMQAVGKLTDRTEEAVFLTEKIERSISRWQNGKYSTIKNQGLSVCYLIWQDPMMTIGQDTFIHHMLRTAGMINVFGDKSRYPSITLEDLQEKSPGYIFLSSEPFPFKGTHVEFFQKHMPKSKTLLVDGQIFSWYGSRLLKAPDYFQFLGTQL